MDNDAKHWDFMFCKLIQIERPMRLETLFQKDGTTNNV